MGVAPLSTRGELHRIGSVAASQLTACLLSVAALAVTPSAALAADPPRPLSYPIVEWGGPGHSAEVFVHGTHGANKFVIDSAEGLVLVRSFKGERIVAGKRCRWSAKWRSVACARPFKVNVFLYGAADEAIVKESARWNFATDVWGGQGRDVLSTASGRRASIMLGGDDSDLLIGSRVREGLFGGPGSDTIRSGGGLDHIDGGHGAFNDQGTPFVRSYARNDGECAARTHGFWDRYDPNFDGPEGFDTLDLSNLSYGVLADLNMCRLGFFSTQAAGLVHTIERVIGTSYNDRLVGDEDANVLTGGRGEDWLTGEGGADRIYAADGAVDTVKCSVGGDSYAMDTVDRRLGC